MTYRPGGRRGITPEDVTALRDFGYTARFSDHGERALPPVSVIYVKRMDIGGDYNTPGCKAMSHLIALRVWPLARSGAR